jgi:hypothetical protein
MKKKTIGLQASGATEISCAERVRICGRLLCDRREVRYNSKDRIGIWPMGNCCGDVADFEAGVEIFVFHVEQRISEERRIQRKEPVCSGCST